MSDVYKTEEEQIEAVKEWWKENGLSIVGGIVIGVSAVFGWRYYGTYQLEQAAEASVIYEDMIIASQSDKTDEAKTAAESIIADYGSTSYAFFANLMLAKQAVAAEELDEAETQLHAALDKSPQDEFKHIVRLRLARVLIQNEKFSEAENILGVNDKGKFLPNYEEVRGDLLAAKGDSAAARKAYEAAASAGGQESVETLLQMKLDEAGKG